MAKTEEKEEKGPSKRRLPSLSKKLFGLIGLLILLAVIGSSFFAYSQYKKSHPPSAQTEIADLTVKVGKLIKIPDETPTVATVSDKNKLKDQPFFANAENGDKVLIFTKAQKAIIYRPSLNKIIEVAPVNLGSTGSTNASPTQAKTIRLAIYNGTKTAGLAKSEGDTLKSKYSNLQIVATTNASADYTKSLVVDLTGSNSQMATTLAGAVGGTVGSLPASESKPDADILIILGQ